MDSMVYGGYTVPKHYDSMIAKLITFGATREEARKRMLRCLDELKVEGIRTNAAFYKQLLQQPDFINNEYTTGFLTKWKPSFD
jgi:acetyl-CoA carboxylase biotin carboxylase subunit